MHWKNHKKTEQTLYCQEHCDPNTLGDEHSKVSLVRSLLQTPRSFSHVSQQVNSEVCEQTFSWLKQFRDTARYMRPGHFLFFALVLCNMRNSEIVNLAKPGAPRQR